MAINLNPGADATLVTAATRASLANAPADYSDAFESVAESYDKTMQASSKIWEDIGEVIGTIGTNMIANAQEWNQYKEVGEKNAAYLVGELETNKQAQKDLGLFGGAIGDKETREERRKLKSQQRELFAEIDFVSQSINTGAENIAAGLFDHELAMMGKDDALFIDAIVASNLKNKVTKAGHQTVLGRDKETDELIFTLQDANGKTLMGKDNKPRTMTVKQFNKSIVDNTKDVDGAGAAAWNAVNGSVYDMGLTSKDGVWEPQMEQAILNQIDDLTKTDMDVRRAMMTRFGYSNTSFADDIKNSSTFSAGLYGSLLKSIGETEDGQVKAEGVLEGIADTDGKTGLSQEEILKNYGVLSANLLALKDLKVSKEYFKTYTVDKFKSTFTYGHGKRPQQKPWEAMGITALQYAKLNQSEEIKFDKATFVPNVIDPGGDREIQVSASSRANAYRNLQNKSRGFQGANGYYGITKNGKYIRYDDKQQYDKAHKGTLNHYQSEDAWEDMFDTPFGTDRYIDATRVAELEGAYSSTIQSNRSSDYYKNLIKK